MQYLNIPPALISSEKLELMRTALGLREEIEALEKYRQHLSPKRSMPIKMKKKQLEAVVHNRTMMERILRNMDKWNKKRENTNTLKKII